MNITKENIVGNVVAYDYRTASIFKSHKIDFCCNGNQSIETVCLKTEIDTDGLLSQLNNAVALQTSESIDFKTWDLDLLADYIEKKHHRYVEKKIPEINAYLNKVVRVHSSNHPELVEIRKLFSASAEELLSHMKKEEAILFPHIRKMLRPSVAPKPHFGTVRNPINMMMQEHNTEGERFYKISALSNNYTPPAEACATYKVLFALLKEFEEDLHQHIHLENNILFPKSIETESKLKYARSN